MKGKFIMLMMVPLFCAFAVKAQDHEWEVMFNGKNLKGWKILNGNAEFRVENGCIIGVSAAQTPNSFLTTGKEYANFVLEYEMMMDKGLNSGMQIRSRSLSSYENGRVYGPQVECDDSRRSWSGGIYDEARKGWRYPLEYNPAARTAYKSGDWNTFRVLAFEHHIITWMNGIPCANLVEDTAESGFIALQVHSIQDSALAGRQVRWKNIRIRPATALDFQELGKVQIPEVSYLRNRLSEKELQQGWKLLWDGTTTHGWRGIKSDKFPEKGWVIRDGILSVEKSSGGESANGGDIVTTRLYRNFILEVDFAITDGANSGIKYFVNTELNKGEGSAIGCEFQILDDKQHPDAAMGVRGNRTMGSLYDLITADGRFYNPDLPVNKYVNDNGQWNRARIVVNGNQVEHWLNGCKIVAYERGTQQWRALVAYSKYRDWPSFGEYAEGNILLQDHGDAVSFCNIKILELP